MNNFLKTADFVLLHSGGGGALPETIIRIYGENWNGTTMSGHIGGTVVENGIVESLPNHAPLNNKTIIRTNGASAYLTLSTFDSGEVANYVVFEVRYMSYIPTNQLGIVIDFYDEVSAFNNLRIYGWRSDDAVGDDEKYWAGYAYGVTSNFDVAQDLPAQENQTVAQVRVFIFENLVGKYYRGGNLILSGGWIPCRLGTGNQRKRIGAVSGGNLSCNLGHLSLHKFPATTTVNKTWVNNYAKALADFYALTWTPII